MDAPMIFFSLKPLRPTRTSVHVLIFGSWINLIGPHNHIIIASTLAVEQMYEA